MIPLANKKIVKLYTNTTRVHFEKYVFKNRGILDVKMYTNTTKYVIMKKNRSEVDVFRSKK